MGLDASSGLARTRPSAGDVDGDGPRDEKWKVDISLPPRKSAGRQALEMEFARRSRREYSEQYVGVWDAALGSRFEHDPLVSIVRDGGRRHRLTPQPLRLLPPWRRRLHRGRMTTSRLSCRSASFHWRSLYSRSFSAICALAPRGIRAIAVATSPCRSSFNICSASCSGARSLSGFNTIAKGPVISAGSLTLNNTGVRERASERKTGRDRQNNHH